MMIFLANFFFIEILNMKLDTILFTVKIPFVKKFLKLCSTIKKINLYSTSREVRFLDKIEYSSTVLQRQVSNQLLSIDRFDNPGCRRGNLTLMSYTCNRMKIP